jgi:hypothetical protein
MWGSKTMCMYCKGPGTSLRVAYVSTRSTCGDLPVVQGMVDQIVQAGVGVRLETDELQWIRSLLSVTVTTRAPGGATQVVGVLNQYVPP